MKPSIESAAVEAPIPRCPSQLSRTPIKDTRSMKFTHHLALAISLAVASLAATAQTVVKEPWVRGTVEQQKVTGLFAQITSTAGGKLVAASSPVSGVVEIHEMSMDGNVMRMRAIPGLDLPAGKPVELKPGGYHLMLMDLKQPLKEGTSVAVTLVIESRDGKRESVEVMAPVRSLSSPAGAAKPR